jgi:hypothetical protein
MKIYITNMREDGVPARARPRRYLKHPQRAAPEEVHLQGWWTSCDWSVGDGVVGGEAPDRGTTSGRQVLFDRDRVCLFVLASGHRLRHNDSPPFGPLCHRQTPRRLWLTRRRVGRAAA